VTGAYICCGHTSEPAAYPNAYRHCCHRTALEAGLAQCCGWWASQTGRQINGRFFRGRFDGWNVAVVEAAPAMPERRDRRSCHQHYNPDIALFVGVAGSIKDVAVGDVVVATKVYGYESGKDTAKGRPGPMCKYRARVAPAHRRQQDGWKKRLDPSIKRQPSIFASADRCWRKSSHQKGRNPIDQEHYGDAVAVEMEGSGFLKGVHINHPLQGCVIRGISDLLSSKASADKAGSQHRAADASSAAAFEMLSGLNGGPGTARKPKPAFVETAQLSVRAYFKRGGARQVGVPMWIR
jgi:nucleoside phosphorylase